jgi:hypothetical protein
VDTSEGQSVIYPFSFIHRTHREEKENRERERHVRAAVAIPLLFFFFATRESKRGREEMKER